MNDQLGARLVAVARRPGAERLSGLNARAADRPGLSRGAVAPSEVRRRSISGLRRFVKTQTCVARRSGGNGRRSPISVIRCSDSNEFLYVNYRECICWIKSIAITGTSHRGASSSRAPEAASPGIALAPACWPKAAVSDPLAPKKPHHPATAKSVIFLFMEGGPSHVDLFDPKPLLDKLDGKPIPASIGSRSRPRAGPRTTTSMAPKRTWKQYGQSGMWVSDWYPNIAEHVDDMTVIRSCWADGLNHVGSVCQMNTGSILAGRPSMGAWVTYGLGTATRICRLSWYDGRPRSAGRHQQLEFRLPSRCLPGHAVPSRRHADPGSQAARRRVRRPAAKRTRLAAFAERALVAR